MPLPEWYQQWFSSPYYHKLYFGRDAQEAAQLIDSLLQHLQPPANSRMLDVACGRGRHSILLANAGHNVTGIVLSAESIEQAQKSESDNLHFYVHDMRRTFWINYFDYAFNFFTSFGYFHTRREHDDAMRTIATSLKPGGTVVFDFLNVHYAEEHLVHNEVKEIDGTAYEIHRWHDEGHFYKRITVTDGQLEKPFEVTEKVAKLSLGDFTELLAFQNMQVTDVFGDYELKPYHVRHTPRMIVLARKMK